jgi:hypothetical protein
VIQLRAENIGIFDKCVTASIRLLCAHVWPAHAWYLVLSETVTAT